MNTKIQAAIHYPQLDSEQRKNEEEEEKSHRASLFKPFPLPFSKEEEKKSKKEEKIIEFRELGCWTLIKLAAQGSCLFIFFKRHS